MSDALIIYLTLVAIFAARTMYLDTRDGGSFMRSVLYATAIGLFWPIFAVVELWEALER